MNPNVTPCMISKLKKACPLLCTMRSIEHMTPLMMFLRLKCLLGRNVNINPNSTVNLDTLFRYIVNNGEDWDIMEFIIELDNEMKRKMTMKNEQTGLYPFMEVATKPRGSLKTIYKLMYSDPGLLFRN